MIGPRWRKVLADLWSNRVRTLLVVLSIAAGVFAVGFIGGGFTILLRDLDADYQSANPHVATILTRPFDDDVIKAIERVPGVARAEGRTPLSVRVRRSENHPAAMRLLAIPSFDKMHVDTLRAEPGSILALDDKEVLVERSSLGALPVKPGDTIEVELPGQRPGSSASVRTLRVAGIVHDVTILPGNMSGEISGYVTPDTMAWLGGSPEFTRLLLTVTEGSRDEEHVRAVAQAAADKLEDGDRSVQAVLVSRPGEHPLAFIIRGLVILLVGLGGMAVGLSGFLVVTTITALLGQQMRQIGVMKAVGADAGQLVGMYLALVLAFGVLALLLAAAPATWLAYVAAGAVASFLNFSPAPFRLPVAALALQTAVALLVPLLAALPPILAGARLTVREAIQHHGLSGGTHSHGHQAGHHALAVPARPSAWRQFWGALRARTISLRLVISVRNSLRRRGRLALTLTTLTLAGAIFIAVFNIRASFAGTIDDTLGYFLANVNVSLSRIYRVEQIEQIAREVPGVTHVESWAVASGQVLSADEKSGIDAVVLAPPGGSGLVKPVLSAGRWLGPGDDNAIVIGNQLATRRPDLRVGDTLTLKILGKKYDWRVVGIYKMAGNTPQAILYANYDYLARTLDQTGRAAALHVVTDAQDPPGEARVAGALESSFRAAGVQVANITTGGAQRQEQQAGVNILVYFLIAMAVLIAMVGGLGLMGTMSMNVMDRTHEIGVMRAIGASTGHIVRLVLLEGLLIGSASWVLGAALALPVSKVLSDLLGQAIVSAPLRLVFTAEGFGLWLAAVLALSALASLWPAYRAARLTVREVLAYE